LLSESNFRKIDVWRIYYYYYPTLSQIPAVAKIMKRKATEILPEELDRDDSSKQRYLGPDLTGDVFRDFQIVISEFEERDFDMCVVDWGVEHLDEETRDVIAAKYAPHIFLKGGFHEFIGMNAAALLDEGNHAWVRRFFADLSPNMYTAYDMLSKDHNVSFIETLMAVEIGEILDMQKDHVRNWCPQVGNDPVYSKYVKMSSDFKRISTCIDRASRYTHVFSESIGGRYLLNETDSIWSL
jgi:hypothetical protein